MNAFWLGLSGWMHRSLTRSSRPCRRRHRRSARGRCPGGSPPQTGRTSPAITPTSEPQATTGSMCRTRCAAPRGYSRRCSAFGPRQHAKPAARTCRAVRIPSRQAYWPRLRPINTLDERPDTNRDDQSRTGRWFFNGLRSVGTWHWYRYRAPPPFAQAATVRAGSSTAS